MTFLCDLVRTGREEPSPLIDVDTGSDRAAVTRAGMASTARR